jgi:hypothetical protein
VAVESWDERMKMLSRYGFASLAALACLALPAAALAQQGAKPAGQANAAKNAKKKPDTAAAAAGQPASTPAATERPIPREQLTPIGRLSIPGGSLGYESRTAIGAYDLSDGRRVPGYENIQRNDSSYFGLSIRMPTGGLLRGHAPD